jgi:tetratricopeptide (TPR) repeat protein
MTVMTSSEAQESASRSKRISAPPENLIEVEVETFQSEALGNFLQDYRQVLKQSKFDISDVLEKSRKDFADIKQENSQTLISTRQNKLPKVVLKRIHPATDQTTQSAPKATPSASPRPDFIFHGFLSKQNLNQRPQPKQKDKHLSLKERQRLGEIKKRRRKETLHFRQSELGRLQTEIEQGLLKEHQAKLIQFSRLIKKLQKQIRRERQDNRKIFLDLGSAYLESQRYLNSLDYDKQIKLARYAPHSGITLGSYELALWTFKMALAQNPNDGDTNFLIGKVFSEMGNSDRALERVRSAENLFIKNRELERAAETRSFIDSLVTTSPKNYKTKF